jgi:5'-AMP-activated protein kinase regulatory gamma subunit
LGDPALAPHAKKSLADLGLKLHRVTGTARESDSLVLALKKLTSPSNAEGALAVVDGSGALVAQLSASDLRGLYEEHFPHLLHSVARFLKEHSPHSFELKTCTLKSTFEEVVRTLVESRIHRLWITDDHRRPVGSVSVSDIVHLVVC